MSRSEQYQNRGERLLEILNDGKEHCAHDFWWELGTAPMRAANELRNKGYDIQTVRLCRHERSNYAVYQMTPQKIPMKTVNITRNGNVVEQITMPI